MSAVSDELQALNASKIDLKVLAEGVVKSMKLYLEQYGMEVNLSVIGSHFFVLADQIHVTNVIYNLIENAVKYRGENKEIHVKLTEEPDTIRVRVADGGIGIPKKYHNQVFERFFRVPTEDRHNVKGYGLGLHYAYNVIKQLGGKMSFTSVEIRGVSFH